ncbi:MAG TPA: TetR/AcrR family transcriptional regulator [Streptosporangiaceae bacterium]
MTEAIPAGAPAPRDSTDNIAGHRRRPAGPLSGRQAEAARNDQRILDSARAVFVSDPGAPITAVAKHAGVGISALYTRYASKDELLRKICTDGLLTYVAGVEEALERIRAGDDHWQVFADFMRKLVAADTTSLTLALAGKFVPTPDMFELANHSAVLQDELFGLVRDVLRPDVTMHDISLMFELVAAIKAGTPERTGQLRRRYLALILDGLRAAEREELPGPAPTWQDVTERWNPS